MSNDPQTTTAVPISVVICCANSEATLAAACESAAFADELIVVDSGSTDATGQIAQQHADRYVVEPWRGYDKQKQFGTTLARNDWVFVLDGDEQISDALRDEVAALPAKVFEQVDVMTMPRLNYIMGRPVRAWLPDTQDRLIQRDRVHWPDEALHERREPADPSRVGHLKNHLLHKKATGGTFDDYFGGDRLDKRLMMVAQQMHERGKRAHWWDLLLRPWLAFAKFYLIKGAWRDGAFGLLIAQKAAVSTQLKYAALWSISRQFPDTQGEQ